MAIVFNSKEICECDNNKTKFMAECSISEGYGTKTGTPKRIESITF